MTSNRTVIYSIAVDSAGNPDIIQLPQDTGPFSKITASVQSPLHAWTLYAPLSGSPSKLFAQGVEYVFQQGPYSGGDILGYVALDSGSDFLILMCER